MRRHRALSVLAFTVAAALAVFGVAEAQEAKALSEKLGALREAAADRDLQQTERLFIELEALGPGDDAHDEARLLLGKTRMALGRLAEAQAAVQAVIDRDPSPWNVKALYLSAEAAARKRDWGLAADVYAKRVEWAASDLHKSEVASLHREIADGAFEGDIVKDEFGREKKVPDWTAARREYEKVRSIFVDAKDAALVSYRIGKCALEMGDASTALAEWTDLLKKGAGEWADDALYGIGLAYQRLGRAADARASFEKLRIESGDSPFAPLALIRIGETWTASGTRSEEETSRAVATWAEFLKLHPSHEEAPAVAWLIGETLSAAGKAREAAEAFRDFVRRFPKDERAAVAQDRIAQALRSIGDFDGAIAEWRTLVATYPNHALWTVAQKRIVETAFAKGSVAFDEKRDADAKAALDQFLAQYPADDAAPNAQRILGDILARALKWAEAVEAWKLVATKYPTSPWAPPSMYQVAVTYEGPLADLEKALAAYEEVVAKWPASPAAQQARGVLAQMKGKTLTVKIERPFRTDEEPKAAITIRNIPKLRFKAYKVRLDEYLRRKGGLAGVENVEVDVVKPDQEWDWATPEFAKYRLIDRPCPLPLAKPGAYVVTAADEELTATFLVVVTDMTVIAKSAVSQALVFVHDERTGEPVAGAKVSLLDGGEGVTGADGVWKKDDLKGSALRAVVVGQGPYAGHYAFAAGSGPAAAAFGYSTKVFLATDRPVYRPGQSVKLRGIVRRVADGRYVTEDNLPLRLRVSDPRGAMLFDEEVRTDAYGVLERGIDLASEPALGDYQVQAEIDGRAFGQTFSVLAYKKPDVLADCDPEQRTYLAGDTVKATVTLRYAVGGAVAGAPVRWSVTRGPFVFDASVHEAFSWFFKDPQREAERIRRMSEGTEMFTSGEGVTDAEGKLALTFVTEAVDADRTYTIGVEAQDPNRRWVRTSSGVPVTMRAAHVICRTEKKVVRPGESIKLEVTTVDPLHVPLALDGRALLVRRRLQHQHFVDEEVMAVPTKTGADGHAVAELKASKPGEHVLRFVAKDARGRDVVGETPVTVSGDAEDLASQARLVADREFYREGDVAKVFVNVPSATATSPAPVLITYEGERVLEYRIIQAKERAQTIELPLRAEHAPNVFLRMAVAKGGKLLEDGDEVAVFQYLDVKVTAEPSELKPGGKVTLKVTTTDQSGKPVRAEIGVDVVDAAIYQIAPDQTPQIKPFFYDQRRTHGVSTCASVGAMPSVTKPTNKDLLFEQMRRLGKAQFEQMQEHVRLGRELLQQGDAQRAGEELRKALEIAPGNYEARGLLDALDDVRLQAQDKLRSDGDVRARAESKFKGAPMSPPAAAAPKPSRSPAKGDAPAAEGGIEDMEKESIGGGGGSGGSFGARRGGMRRLKAGGGGKKMEDAAKDNKNGYLDEQNDANEADGPMDASRDEPVADAALVMDYSFPAEWGSVQARRSAAMQTAVVVPAELRQRFADTALAALVRTGDDGSGTVEVELPDNLTEWKVNARGASQGPLVGEGATRFRTAKHLLVRPDSPRFLTQGDWTTATGTIHSSLDAEADVTLKFGADGLTVGGDAERQVKVRPGEVLPFDARLDAPAHGLGTVRIDALTSVESDAARFGLPILPWGLRRLDGASGTLVDDAFAELELPANAVAGTQMVTVTLSQSIDVALLESLAYTGSYPWGCVEQTVNRFLPALAASQALSDAGSPNARLKAGVDAMVARGLAALYSMQSDDGSFGWFGARAANDSVRGGGSPEMTAYALLGFVRAEQAGFRVSTSNRDRCIQAALGLLRGASAEDRAFLLYGLSFAQRADLEVLNALHRERTTLRARGLALLALTMQKTGRPANALELVRLLESKATRAPGAASWDADRSMAKSAGTVADIRRHISYDAEPTAYALLAFLATDPQNLLVDEAAAWLTTSRRGPAWRSTRDTAAAIEALAVHMASRGVARSEGDVQVFANDSAEPVATVKFGGAGVRPVDAPEMVQIPVTSLVAGKNKVRLHRAGAGRVHWSMLATAVEPPAKDQPIAAGAVVLAVDRELTEWFRPRLPGEAVEERIVPGWSVVVAGKRPVWNGRPLRVAGTSDKIRVTLRVSSKEPVTNVLVEDWFPAGCEVVQGSAEGPFDREERRDDRQAFFLGRVHGTVTLSYVLQAIHPGEYRSLPAEARAMYEPEIHGWTGESKLTVSRDPGAIRRGASPEEITPDEVWGLALRAFAQTNWADARRGLEGLKSGPELVPEVQEELYARLFAIGVETKDAKLTAESHEQLVDRNPRRAASGLRERRALADAYRTLGENERATVLYRDLVRDLAQPDVEAAQAWSQIGNPWRAKDLLVALLRRSPDTGWVEEAELNIARMTMQLRAPVPAAAGVARRIPFTTDAQPLLLSEGVRMLRSFQAHHAESPLSHEAGFLAVQTLLRMDLGADAVKEGARFLTRHPKSKYLDDVTLLVAQGHFQAAAYDQALQAANALLAGTFPSDGNPDVLVESPFRSQAIHLAAKVAHLRGDLPRAVDLYRKVSSLFPDAADAERFLTEKGLQLREVETCAVGGKPVLHLRRKNTPEVTVEVYAVDFMILYALRRNLADVNKIDLAGIEPVKRWSVARKGAEDFRWNDEEVELPANQKGVYLVTARAEGLFASSIVLVSDLQVDVQEADGRLRIYTTNRVTGAPLGEVYVKVGNGSTIQAQGFTDARGVLDVPAVGGSFSVVAEKDGNTALWRR
ncbi:MAG: tetratricopeptide repeat protein [Planctomycetes bacterium]|nr:tetratricopeptide repeat protein [Planctomycetota bacterium]